MVKHNVLVQGVDMHGTTQSEPVLLQMNDTDFPAHFLQDLAHPDQPPVSSTAQVDNASGPATLFQPVQRIVHLAMVQLNCDTLGLPPLATTRVQSAGLVIRRVYRKSATPLAYDDTSALPFAWMHSAAGSFDWVQLKPGQECQDPDPQKRPQLQSGSAELDQRFGCNVAVHAMTEVFTPAFVAPPDVCNALGRTIVYALIPTASSDVSDTQPQPPSFADPDDRQNLSDNLPIFLKTGTLPRRLQINKSRRSGSPTIFLRTSSHRSRQRISGSFKASRPRCACCKACLRLSTQLLRGRRFWSY